LLFNSYIFIFLFLPTSLLVYFFLTQKRLTFAAKSWLILASLFFYSYWNISYLPIILLSVIFNYSVGTSLIGEEKGKSAVLISREKMLIFGITINLFLLGYYKYSNFVILNLNFLFHSRFEHLEVELPLGISFFTFTQIAYLVDSHSHKSKDNNFLNYVLFVTFFPHLIAGPIVHHKNLMPQFDILRNKILNYRNIAKGLFLFSIGLFKKTMIADSLSVWAVEGFDKAVSLDLVQAWITSLAYSFQLYFDFSAYIDMALGAALMFNVILPANFNSPYQATDIQDFWRRWHMTLTRFLRDYIYIPLGGNQFGESITYRNIFITFLLGGLWHGASWTFVFWGALHAFAMIVYRIWAKAKVKTHPLIGWFVTFNFVNATWVFFRAKTWADAVKVLKGMLGLNGIVLPDFLAPALSFVKNDLIGYARMFSQIKSLSFIFILFCAVLLVKNSDQMTQNFKPTWRNLAFSWMGMSVGLMGWYRVQEFLYFNF
jgi:D-alanyl-lipoteichoic acid acyltransferase DltB (MBOAT superfamily)